MCPARLFRYAVLFHGRSESTSSTQILVPPTEYALYGSEHEVIAEALGDPRVKEYLDRLRRVEVLVEGFGSNEAYRRLFDPYETTPRLPVLEEAGFYDRR